MLVAMLRTYRNHTSMGDIAHYILKLDCGVMNVETRRQYLFHLAQDGLTFRNRNIGNAYVA